MSAAEIIYSFRIGYPDVIQREREQIVDLKAYVDGALAAPTSGTFSLIKPDGTKAIDAVAVTITSSVAQYTIPAASLPDTLPLSELYLEEWKLVMPDTTTRTVRREAAVSKFPITPVLCEADIVEGEYPDIVSQLGNYASNLQGFMDEAWTRLLRRLWSNVDWPSLYVSNYELRDVHRETTLFLIMKFLFRRTSGDNRFERLMDYHHKAGQMAYDSMTFRMDKEQDNKIDGLDRRTNTTVVHRNAAPRVTLAKSYKW